MLANFLADHPYLAINKDILKEIYIQAIGIKPCELCFDDLKTKYKAIIGVVLVSSHGCNISLAFLLNF